MNETLIIAEAGVNHNGDIVLAKQLIDTAADAGVDFVKFQTFKAESVVTLSSAKATYQINETGEKETQLEMLRRLELTPDMHKELIVHCKAKNISFLSTAFDIESIDLLSNLGQELFKVPSGEITNLPYLRHVGSLGKAIILSSGMATLDEVKSAVEVLEEAGTLRSNITVLHCTTEYPAPMSEVNLRAMQTIQTALQVAVGYSDHTQGIEVPIASVALGAAVVEKHFTLDRNLPGPDHKASLEPAELKAMVHAIRNIEIALGTGVKMPTKIELQNKPIVRKSLVARQPIKAGDIFSVKNITPKRPGTGISPMKWDEVIGRTARRDFAVDDLIEL